MGDEIYEIFTEEVSEICDNLNAWYPEWDAKRQNRELLTDIRRGFHTLKGSGRMAGAFALGDFAWAHESMLNQALSGQIPLDNRLSQQVLVAIDELIARKHFYQNATAKDEGVERMVAAAEAVMAGKDPISLAPPTLPVAPTIPAPLVAPAVIETKLETIPQAPGLTETLEPIMKVEETLPASIDLVSVDKTAEEYLPVVEPVTVDKPAEAEESSSLAMPSLAFEPIEPVLAIPDPQPAPTVAPDEESFSLLEFDTVEPVSVVETPAPIVVVSPPKPAEESFSLLEFDAPEQPINFITPSVELNKETNEEQILSFVSVDDDELVSFDTELIEAPPLHESITQLEVADDLPPMMMDLYPEEIIEFTEPIHEDKSEKVSQASLPALMDFEPFIENEPAYTPSINVESIHESELPLTPLMATQPSTPKLESVVEKGAEEVEDFTTLDWTSEPAPTSTIISQEPIDEFASPADWGMQTVEGITPTPALGLIEKTETPATVELEEEAIVAEHLPAIIPPPIPEQAFVKVEEIVEKPVVIADEPTVIAPVVDVKMDPVQEAEKAKAKAKQEQQAETQLIWQLFWEEFPDQLQSLDTNIQRLQENPSDRELIRELEREFHTLKGGARMAQLTALANVSHEAESLLAAQVTQGGLSIGALDSLQKSVDQLHILAEQAKASGIVSEDDVVEEPKPLVTLSVPQPVAIVPEPVVATVVTPPVGNIWQKPAGQAEYGSMLERILAEQGDTLPDISILGLQSQPEKVQAVVDIPAAANSHETIRLPASFVDNVIDRVVGLNVQQVRLSEHFNSMGIDVEELVRTVSRLRQQVRALELESEAQIHDGRSQRSTINHSSGGQFDALEMDQYAEIQRISRSLAESLNDLVNLEADLSSQLRKGEELLQENMRTTRKVQQDLLDTRLVALTMLVPRLRRLTRQTASELGKQVMLEVEGEDCELDRHLLQNMTAPLEHLIRNAVSHGIELPEDRLAKGKTETGKITLSVSRDEAEIIIRFRDDGRGLNRQQLRQRGIELGLITSNTPLTDNELDRLILRPGFTTAKSVSQISGRGIGMDVVYSELKALGGSLQIESFPGKGIEFVMRLPFTLIVNPVLLVEADSQVFALPISGIQGLTRLSGEAIQKALASDKAAVEFAGQNYHIRQLSEHVGSGKSGSYDASEMFPVIFFHIQGQSVAWVIEHIRGRREVVLQPLGVLFKDCRLYSAATVAPDGSVFLVPDMAELARRVKPMDEPAANDDVPAVAEVKVSEPKGPARIMVVDDSVTVRRVTEKFLLTKDYVVSTAKDGMEALEKVGEFEPDAVLLDIEMPRMDGFELLGHLRHDNRWQRLPVIMISSRTAPRHKDHAMSLGATEFLGKPYQNEILLSTIEQVLQSGHQPQKAQTSA